MRLKGAIFDLDGTLVNTMPICIGGFREVFRTYVGRDYSDEEIHATFGPSEEGSFQRAIPDSWEEGLRLYLHVYEAMHDSCTAPFEGLLPLLERLKANGVRLAIVTGKGAGSAEISLRYTRLNPLFERVETGSTTGSVKAIQIRAIAEEWGFLPTEVGYLGDMASDMRIAREANVLALGACWANSADITQIEALHPDANFRTVQAFWDWLQLPQG